MDAKIKDKSIDYNWVLVGNPNIITHAIARVDPKPRTIHIVELAPAPLAAILKGMKRLEMNFSQTTNVL